MKLDSLTAAQRKAFADAVLERISGHPLGTVTKRELDIALFTGLVSAGFLDADESQFSMARKLGITPTRVRTLMYAYRLARADGGGDLAAILPHVRVVSIDAAGDAVLNAEDAFARDAFIARLKELDVYTNGSFNRERITVPTDLFMAALDDAFGKDGERIRTVIEQQLAERGREGRVRFVGDLGKKLIGDAAGVTLKALLAAAT